MRASTHMRERARSLRKSQTISEQRIWGWLRNRSFSGFKFRRQVAAGRYVLDFYCPELKLALEIDGRHHGTQWMSEFDSERTLYLRARGIAVARITNELIVRDSWMAGQAIEAEIRHRARELGLEWASP